MRRRAVALLAATAAVAAVAVGSHRLIDRGDRDAAADTTQVGQQISFAAITRQDLLRYEELAATIGYGEPSPIVIPLDGTITALPAVGDVIEPGGRIAEIDGRPVLTAEGSVPMWRDLGPGVTDGVDVRQVEEMLAALGYAEAHDVTVDDKWTNATTRAIREFQKDSGLPVTGTIGRGELIFLDGPVRVNAVAGHPGQAAGDAGITVTATDLRAVAKVGGRRLDLLSVGDTVDVELPIGEVLPGTVTGLGAAATDDDGKSERSVDVTLDDNSSDAVAPGTSVTIRVSTASATDVLTVPVEALLAVAEGGYAVEARTPSGATILVGVDVGTFADGRVEITPTTGTLTELDEVVVP